MNFNVGDKVKCVDTGASYQLVKGRVYEVIATDSWNDRISVKNDRGDKLVSSFGTARFEKYSEPKEVKTPELSKDKFVVGQKVRVKKNLRLLPDKLGLHVLEAMVGSEGKVLTIENIVKKGMHNLVTMNENWFSWNEDWLEPISKSLVNLGYGDVIVGPYGDKFTVQGRADNVIFYSRSASTTSGIYGINTPEALEANGYKLYEEPKKTKMTRAQIAEKLHIPETELVIV